MKHRPLQIAKLAGVCVCICSFGAMAAEKAGDFPAKPVALIVPVAAGGTSDTTSRAVATVATKYLGQPVIVQLKPGGGGAIGSEFVAKANPDGYTLLSGAMGWSSTLPAVEGRSKGPDDLAAVCRINYSAVILVVRPELPFKTLPAMVEYAKANPDKVIFGNTGPWGVTDLALKMIAKETGIKMRNVPHDGGGPALVAILGGNVDVIGRMTADGLPYIKSGKLHPLAILDDKREQLLPEVPTAKEQGLNVYVVMWRSVLAPKATPRPVIDKLAKAFKEMTEDKSVVSMIEQMGDHIQFLGPDEFGKLWRAEFEQQKELGRQLKN